MIALTRIEVWHDGEFHHSRVVANANVGKVYTARMTALGFYVLQVYPRTETERAS